METKEKRVTIKDVAEYCGLSKSLVAYLINDSGYRKSTPENRKKVEAAVKALNYRPNRAAKELSSGKCFTIGIAMPMSGTSFYGDIALELQQAVKKRGFTSLFSFWGGDDPEEMHDRPIETLFARNIDGVISWDPSPRFREQKIPAVVYDRETGIYDNVAPDDEAMIERALDHLANFGHRTVGILSMGERNRIFVRKVPESGLKTSPEWIFELTPWKHRPLDAFGQFYRNCGGHLPDALIFHSDAEAVAAISSAYRLGIQVPRDLSAVVLSSSMLTDFFHPALDVFDIRVEEIAAQLVERLLARIKHPEAPVETVKVVPRLIRRESVAKQPLKGDLLS